SSKIRIIKDKKTILFNEEAVQSLNLDASGSKVMFVVTLKNETENNKDNRESSIYVVNIKGSSLENNIEMLKEYVAPEMLRSVTVNDDGTAIIKIDDNALSVFEKLFKNENELKILYQENLTGELKLLKDSYDINEVFHKVSKVNTKRNIIGKEDEVQCVEKVIKINS
ncbi:MAG TPA: hypothetical protein PLI56_08020, partial [Exilispira sp.]|nr:hypothetical protein [Exilispira sp.]